MPCWAGLMEDGFDVRGWPRAVVSKRFQMGDGLIEESCNKDEFRTIVVVMTALTTTSMGVDNDCTGNCDRIDRDRRIISFATGGVTQRVGAITRCQRTDEMATVSKSPGGRISADTV